MTLTQKRIEHLRCLYEQHTKIVEPPKDKVSEAEYKGVKLGLDMVMDLNESIKEFEDVPFKIALEENQASFLKLTIKVKKQIVYKQLLFHLQDSQENH